MGRKNIALAQLHYCFFGAEGGIAFLEALLHGHEPCLYITGAL